MSLRPDLPASSFSLAASATGLEVLSAVAARAVVPDLSGVFASISMIATGYGGCLSQDRLAFEYRGGGDGPEFDLGHDLPTYCFNADGTEATDCRDLLRWAVGLDRIPVWHGLNGMLSSFPVFSATV